MDTKGITFAPDLEKALLDLGFSEFTEIQEKCIPLIQQGRDVIGLSYTGSGKTAAFGFPTLEKVQPGKGLQLLVIVPTRELCNQVAKEFRKFTKYRKTYIVEVYGGVSINPQIDHLRRAEVVVGTPGRLLDHLSRNTLHPNQIKILVLDEADKMFEMGFIEDIQQIMSTIPPGSQKLLFSATMSSDILNLVKNFMHEPEKVKMQEYVDKDKLLQHYYDIDRRNKFSLLVHVIHKEAKGLVLVFCGTRHIVDSVARNLNKQNIKALALHGGITQHRRNDVMQMFRDGKLDVLVATDVAARGLDIKNVNLVINYDIPKTSQEYVHRIGRTARAGMEGKVISLLTAEDYDNFRHVLEDRSLLIDQLVTPEFERVPFVRAESSGFGFQQQRPGQYQRPGQFQGRYQGPRHQQGGRQGGRFGSESRSFSGSGSRRPSQHGSQGRVSRTTRASKAGWRNR